MAPCESELGSSFRGGVSDDRRSLPLAFVLCPPVLLVVEGRLVGWLRVCVGVGWASLGRFCCFLYAVWCGGYGVGVWLGYGFGWCGGLVVVVSVCVVGAGVGVVVVGSGVVVMGRRYSLVEVDALRRDVAWLRVNPGQIETLRHLMGHESIATTQRYLDDVRREDAMQTVVHLNFGADDVEREAA